MQAGRPFGTSAGGFFSGHSGFPPLRLFVWFRKNSVHVWGQTYQIYFHYSHSPKFKSVCLASGLDSRNTAPENQRNPTV